MNNPNSILTQDDLNKPILPTKVEQAGEKANAPYESWTCFHVVLFHLELCLSICDSLWDLLIHYDLASTQFISKT